MGCPCPLQFCVGCSLHRDSPEGRFLSGNYPHARVQFPPEASCIFLLSSNIKTRTPISNPPNQSFSRSDGSIVPTSLTY